MFEFENLTKEELIKAQEVLNKMSIAIWSEELKHIAIENNVASMFKDISIDNGIITIKED